MIYDIDTTISYLEHNFIKGNTLNDLYYALNQGGIRYANFSLNGRKIKWDCDSSLKEFIDFFDNLGLCDPKSSGKLDRGDLFINPNGKTIYYMFNDCNHMINNNEYIINDWHKYAFAIKTTLPSGNACIIKLSKIVYSIILYDSMLLHNMYTEGKSHEFKKIFLLCCLNDDTLKKNFGISSSQKEYFDNIVSSLKDSTKNSSIIDKFNRYIDGIELLSKQSTPSKNKKTNSNTENPDKPIQKHKDNIKKYYNKLLYNKSSNQIKTYFSSKENRQSFQNRYSMFLQLFCKNNESSFSRECVTKSNNEKELYTLTDKYKDYCNSVIKYVTNNSECKVESIYDLAGYIFDSVTPTTDTDTRKLDEEYHKFQSMAKCYGVGGLDYYFALERNKDINHYAAMELANIYFFGSEFDGYKVERDREKCIKLLETCQAYLPNARWSLGENYLRLSEKYERFIKEYQREHGENPEYRYRKEEFRDYEREDYEKEKESCGSQNFIEFMKDKKEDLRKKRMGLYSACGNYTPAINSLARDYIALAKTDNSHRNEYVKKALSYATKAALGGWVYGFNNLFELINNNIFKEARENCPEEVKLAFDVLYENRLEQEVNLKRLNDAKLRMTTNEGIENYGVVFKYLEDKTNAYNFLIVSAYLGNIWAARRLGWELVAYPDTSKFAIKLLNHVVKYDPKRKEEFDKRIKEFHQ